MNRAEHVCAFVIIKHNYILMCELELAEACNKHSVMFVKLYWTYVSKYPTL